MSLFNYILILGKVNGWKFIIQLREVIILIMLVNFYYSRAFIFLGVGVFYPKFKGSFVKMQKLIKKILVGKILSLLKKNKTNR